MRNAQRCAELFRQLGYDGDQLIWCVNRYQQGLAHHPRGDRGDGRAAGAATVGNDFLAHPAPINRGVLLWEEAPRSPVTRDVDDLAARVDAGPREAPAPAAAAPASSSSRRRSSMGLELSGCGSAPTAPRAARTASLRHGIGTQVFHDLKTRAAPAGHRQLDLKTLEKLSPEQLREQLRSILGAMLLAAPSVPLNQGEREQMVQELLDELTGLGPLEPLLRDASISDILVNTYSTVYIERRGKLELTGRALPRQRPPAADHQPHRLAGRPARGRDLADGGRPPARRLARQRHHPAARHRRPDPLDPPLRRRRRCESRTWSPSARVDRRDAWPSSRACVKAKLNILISGGTGTGKTTLLNALSAFIPGERAHRHHRGRRRAAAAAARTWSAWRPGRPTSRARARSWPATWCATACACAPTASSSARSAAPRSSTCSRP